MIHSPLKQFSVLLLTFVSANIAHGAQPSANLAVSAIRPASEKVNTPNQYVFVVANVGNREAKAVKLELNLPVTNTSPQKFLMGFVTDLDSRCAIALGKITCLLGTIKNSKSTDVRFKYSIPVSTASVAINAAVTSDSPDSLASNNSLQFVPAQSYFSLVVSGPVNVSNSHCTGSVGLSSYFECERFPSSISQHAAVFHANGTITFPDEPDYYGFWQQSPTARDRISFQYLYAGQEILSFQGFGSTTACFDGVSLLPESPTYVSPYRVCF